MNIRYKWFYKNHRGELEEVTGQRVPFSEIENINVSYSIDGLGFKTVGMALDAMQKFIDNGNWSGNTPAMLILVHGR